MLLGRTCHLAPSHGTELQRQGYHGEALGRLESPAPCGLSMLSFPCTCTANESFVSPQHPTDVDYRVMATFTEFYTTLLGFVNFRLYQSINLHYPPKVGSQPGSFSECSRGHGPSLPAWMQGAVASSSSDLPPALQLEGQAQAEVKANEDTYALDSESSMEVRGF